MEIERWCALPCEMGRLRRSSRFHLGTARQSVRLTANPATRGHGTDRSFRDGAKDVVDEYHKKIGGDPAANNTGAKRKGRKSNAATESATPTASNKRIKQEQAWEPPKGSWETEVDYVDTVEETPDPTTGKLTRYAYLVWSNRKKTQHPLPHVYQKCPQKVRIPRHSLIILAC